MTHQLDEMPLFCTMKASVPYIQNPNFKYLKLNRFYKTLFDKKPEVGLHNALSDAQITAEIFFHLLQNGKVTDQIINEQKATLNRENLVEKKLFNWLFPVLISVLVLLLIWLYYE
ncbi:hypothetical protein N9R54_05505, partial [Pelobium sp.]|nr:hypothetical protein [Pelobium sp.]